MSPKLFKIGSKIIVEVLDWPAQKTGSKLNWQFIKLYEVSIKTQKNHKILMNCGY